MSTILITGGMGFVGIYTARELARRGDRVIVFDPDCVSSIEQHGGSWGGAQVGDIDGSNWLPAVAKYVLGHFAEQVVFVRGNVLNIPELLDAVTRYKVEKIIHAAAIFDPLIEFENPYEAFKVNVEGAVSTFEIARLLKIGRVVFLSSVAAYGIKQYEPINEAHPTTSIESGNPSGPHGSVKVAAEVLGMTYYSAYGVDFVGLRLVAAFGVGMRLPLHIRPMVESAVDGVACLFEQGEMRREYMYIADTVQGVLKALDVDANVLSQRIFNLGSGVITSTQELADAVRSVIPRADIKVGTGMSDLEASNFRMRGSLDVTATRSQLGFVPAYNLNSGIAAYAQDLRDFRSR